MHHRMKKTEAVVLKEHKTQIKGTAGRKSEGNPVGRSVSKNAERLSYAEGNLSRGSRFRNLQSVSVYEEKAADLGLLFLDEIEKAIIRILANPMAYPSSATKSARRWSRVSLIPSYT